MKKQAYYVQGNVVRQAEPAPQEPKRRVRQDIENDKKKRLRQNAARRNRERAMYMGKGYVAFLSVCVVLSAFAAVTYINLQSSISHRMRSIAALEAQVAEMKADNDALDKRLTTSVDLNEIKRIAMDEMGMQYATEDQIVYYTIENNNYMDQYRDIPTK